MAIIFPEGIVDAWQAAHATGTSGGWCDLDNALLRQADAERDFALRDDIYTLADVAWSRAMDVDFLTAIALRGI